MAATRTDVWPARIKGPDGQRYPRARLLISKQGRVVAWTEGRGGRRRVIDTTLTGGPRRGPNRRSFLLDTEEGTFEYAKGSGCGCGSGLRRESASRLLS